MAEFDFGDVGDIMGGAGGLIGAVSSLFGKKKQKMPGWQKKMAKAAFYEPIRIRVADAKAAGIHPLAALGANVGGGGSFASPVQDTSYNWGDAIGDGLSSVGGALSSMGARRDQRRLERADADRQQQADFQNLMDRMNQESMAEKYYQLDAARAAADIAETRSRTLLTNARMAALGAAGSSNTLVGPRKPSKLHTILGDITVDPDRPGNRMSSNQEWQDYLGDLGDWIGGANNLIQMGGDAVADRARKWIKPWQNLGQ